MYYWVLYAMFMLHPENTNEWRATDQLRFESLAHCENFFHKEKQNLIKGLSDNMESSFGDKENYTLLELGCTMAKDSIPSAGSRIPLHNMEDLQQFIESTLKLDV